MDVLFTIIGFFGMGFLVLGYFLVNSGKIADNNPWFHVINLLGAGGILVSLLVAWNLPIFILESSWAAISLVGLWRCLKKTSE